MRLACIAACSLLLGACSGAPKAVGPKKVKAPAPSPIPKMRDQPYRLAANPDLASATARYQAMELGDRDREPLRIRIANELGRRIDAAFARRARATAFRNLQALLQLWTADELASGGPAVAALSQHARRIRRVRASFARSGGDTEATTALLALTVVDPKNASRYKTEIELIFKYSDELSVARYGDGAERARPISILETAVESVPVRFAVDRLGQLYVARQKALTRRFRQRGPDFALIRAHGNGVLRTTWNIVRVYAKAGRLAESTKVVSTVRGIGDDRALRALLSLTVERRGTAPEWIELIESFLGARDRNDPKAALAVAKEASKRFPKDASVVAAAASVAQRMGNTPLAIRYFERALALDPDRRVAAERLADLYQDRINDLLDGERPVAALRRLEQLEAFHARVRAKWPRNPLDAELAKAYATVGRGLVALGELDRATPFLGKSIKLSPNTLAYEFLGTVALKQQRYAEAARYLDAALGVTGRSATHIFNRAKILRLASEAHGGAGNKLRMLQYARSALGTWFALKDRLPNAARSEMHVERGKLLWALGDRAAALRSFDAAIDLGTNDANAHAAVISFLVVRDQYSRALDAYHRALGSRAIGAYFKVYMSLWVLAEAKRTKRPADSLAAEYLSSRRGGLWYDQLARFASGRLDASALRRLATTRARRAEMLYYLAVLGPDAGNSAKVKKLLEGVLATNAILFFEFDMARHLLAQPASRK